MAFNTIQINEAELQLINDISDGRKKTIATIQAEINELKYKIDTKYIKNDVHDALLVASKAVMQAEINELKLVLINVAADITREFVEDECTEAQHRRLVSLILKLRDAAITPPEKMKHSNYGVEETGKTQE